ncbi:MAG: hypothetical protein ACRBN8_45150 [Nannocystales bacterium]
MGLSLPDLIGSLHELSELGVSFISLTEALGLTTPIASRRSDAALSMPSKARRPATTPNPALRALPRGSFDHALAPKRDWSRIEIPVFETPTGRARHADSSGVRGAEWSWP